MVLTVAFPCEKKNKKQNTHCNAIDAMKRHSGVCSPFKSSVECCWFLTWVNLQILYVIMQFCDMIILDNVTKWVKSDIFRGKWLWNKCDDNES